MKKKRRTGRPPLKEDQRSMRYGFVILKDQYLAITEIARKEGVTPSVIARRALDLLIAASV